MRGTSSTASASASTSRARRSACSSSARTIRSPTGNRAPAFRPSWNSSVADALMHLALWITLRPDAACPASRRCGRLSLQAPLSRACLTGTIGRDTMRLTLSVIKADVGSIGGHTKPSERMLDAARQAVKEAIEKGLLIDGYVAHTGDDIALVMSHRRGKGYPEIH